ncbi:MAG TPA: cache domain-containing protein [Methanospirillum sp.]|nr:cache domain-containing protein [Methanospirillum sp.]
MLQHCEKVYYILILLLIVGIGTGIVSGTSGGSIQTPQDLVRYVNEAGQFLSDNGVDRGVEMIMNGSDFFTRTGAVLSVYDQDGVLLAHPAHQDEIGENRLNLTDPYGLEIIRLERDIAKNGGGFFFLMDSASLDATNGDPLPRLGYVHPVTDQIWIASDISLSDKKDQKTGTPYLSGLETFVGKAVAYARNEGNEKAINEFNDLNGSFTKGSQYIYAYDMDGIFLASPYYPDLIGTNQNDVVRSYGVASVAEGIRIASGNGSGYIAFVILNPETNKPESKLGYFERVDDTWFVGSGVYGSDLLNLASHTL